MRVKKRVKRGVKKGIKSVKSAPPGAYLAGAGVLVGGAAVVLLATTKSGQELLIRTAQLMLHPATDEQESQESDVQEDVQDEPVVDARVEEDEDTNGEDESDVQEDEYEEPAEDARVEEDEDTNGEDESEVADLKPRTQRPRSTRKAPAQRKATSA
ncbi:MAG TPA: hypothetical protein VFY56_09230 [Propionibacteriaceae bacterium]|nr:hypothetical protein [Propionibacteriaceae bacterium]